jgi:hypothetical protein
VRARETAAAAVGPWRKTTRRARTSMREERGRPGGLAEGH